MFAAAETTKKTGSKSQVGRWKGLDEDISDDQVHQPSLSIFCLERVVGLPNVSRTCIGHTTWSSSVASAASLHCFPGRADSRCCDSLCKQQALIRLRCCDAMQQDITRGRNMVDSLYQGATGNSGTHNAIMSSEVLHALCHCSSARMWLSTCAAVTLARLAGPQLTCMHNHHHACLLKESYASRAWLPGKHARA